LRPNFQLQNQQVRLAHLVLVEAQVHMLIVVQVAQADFLVATQAQETQTALQELMP